ncbi:UNKNOWN [Stylonychia lemnae]|uniref:Uncharacterized protein n=1 Tax=Stylonychia lemnae TaxID=5949 RepID=A0A078AR72_STYLE|nr:UNKNOWN [Stylonychia lemnae]|eukprot:CDW83742.1 UNKNOWN [Stylonychia lemnae]
MKESVMENKSQDEPEKEQQKVELENNRASKLSFLESQDLNTFQILAQSQKVTPTAEKRQKRVMKLSRLIHQFKSNTNANSTPTEIMSNRQKISHKTSRSFLPAISHQHKKDNYECYFHQDLPIKRIRKSPKKMMIESSAPNRVHNQSIVEQFRDMISPKARNLSDLKHHIIIKRKKVLQLNTNQSSDTLYKSTFFFSNNKSPYRENLVLNQDENFNQLKSSRLLSRKNRKLTSGLSMQQSGQQEDRQPSLMESQNGIYLKNLVKTQKFLSQQRIQIPINPKEIQYKQ